MGLDAAVPGTRLGRYTILAGGAEVRAYDPVLQREVALVPADAGEPPTARLAHPNLVAVYDVEELGGRTVAVTEYIAGQTLRAWLDEAPRGGRAVVETFIAAGRGLAAAHARGIVHGSFDASSVIVAADGRIKVVGVGRGNRPSTPVDDQRSFCLALQDALSAEMCSHFTSPGIRDAIARGLAPNPDDRWPSMTLLLRVLARRPADRRREVIATVGAVALVAFGVTAPHLWVSAQARRCGGARARLGDAWSTARRAQAEEAFSAVEAPFTAAAWARTSAAMDDYATRWVEMHEDTCAATSIRAEQSSEVMDLRMTCLLRARVALAAAATLFADADAEVVARAHTVVAELPPLARCADVPALREAVEPPLSHEAAAVEDVRALLAAAAASLAAGRADRARADLVKAEGALDGVVYGPVRTELALQRADTLRTLGDFAGAEAAAREALTLASRWRQRAAMGLAASALIRIVGFHERRFEEGYRYAEIARGALRAAPVEAAAARDLAAAVLGAEGRHAEAEAESRAAIATLQEALGPSDPRVAAARGNLALLLHGQGRYAAAREENEAALRVLEAELGPEHPDVATVRYLVAEGLKAEGRYAEAEAEHREVLALREASLGPDHPNVAASHSGLSAALVEQRRLDEAYDEQRIALELWEASVGPNHPLAAWALNRLGRILMQQRRPVEAEAHLRRSIAIFESRLGPAHGHVARVRVNLANALGGQERFSEAAQEMRRALDVLAAENPEHADLAHVRVELALWLLEAGEAGQARAQTDLAWPVVQHVPSPNLVGIAAFITARARWATGDREARAEAHALARRALAAFEDAGELADAENVAELEAWLRSHPAPPHE